MNSEQIAQKFGVHRNTILNWAKKLKESGKKVRWQKKGRKAIKL